MSDMPPVAFDTWTDAEKERALAAYTVRQQALWFASLLELAVRVNPEAVRAALERAFDLGAVKHMTRRAWKDSQEALSFARRTHEEASALVESVNLDTATLERTIEGLRAEVELLRRELRAAKSVPTPGGNGAANHQRQM